MRAGQHLHTTIFENHTGNAGVTTHTGQNQFEQCCLNCMCTLFRWRSLQLCTHSQ
jgi:hypothetical protein